MKKLFFIVLVCFTLQSFGTKISKAYEALSVYDYFKAKHLFYKTLQKKTAEASFGLATIYYRTDNPFSNIDSAAKYISICNSNLTDTSTYSSFHINKNSLKFLSNFIALKGIEKYTTSNSIHNLNHFLTTFTFANDSLKKHVLYLRDNNRLNYYTDFESSDSVNVFLLKFPESQLYERAKKIFYNVQYTEQTKDNTPEQFKYFIKTFTNNPNKLAAENKLFDLIKQLHNCDSLYIFIKKYSSNITKLEAWKMLYSESVKNYTQDNLTSFIKKYPDYPYSVDVLKEIMLSKKELIPLKNTESKFGYIDTLGNWIIQPIYDDANPFAEGFAAVCKNDSCFYINKDGIQISNLYFDETNNYNDGVAIVKKGANYFLINKTGQVITKGYEDINDVSENLYVSKINGLYGAINAVGKAIIPFSYNKLGNFKNGYAYYLSNQYGLVDVNNYTLKAQWDWISDVDTNALVIVKKENKFGLMKLNEQLLLNNEFDLITPCTNGIYLVVKNNLYGFYNSKERCFITSIDYDYDKGLANDYYTNGKQFKLLKNDEVGLVDANGRFSINFGTYTNLFFAKCDIIRVQKNNKYGFVDRKLKLINPIEYDKATDYENDLAIVSKKNITSLINKSGKSIFSIKDGNIQKTINNLYLSTSNNLIGIVNHLGEIILPPEYLEIETLTKDLFRCKKAEDIFLFNSKTRTLLKL